MWKKPTGALQKMPKSGATQVMMVFYLCGKLTATLDVFTCGYSHEHVYHRRKTREIVWTNIYALTQRPKCNIIKHISCIYDDKYFARTNRMECLVARVRFRIHTIHTLHTHTGWFTHADTHTHTRNTTSKLLTLRGFLYMYHLNLIPTWFLTFYFIDEFATYRLISTTYEILYYYYCCCCTVEVKQMWHWWMGMWYYERTIDLQKTSAHTYPNSPTRLIQDPYYWFS